MDKSANRYQDILLARERRRLLANVLRTGAIGGLLGAGVGSGYQLSRTLLQPDIQAGPVDPAQADVALPYPAPEEPKEPKEPEEKERRKKPAFSKYASDEKQPSYFDVASDWLAERFWPKTSPSQPTRTGVDWKDLLTNHPWALPAGFVAGGVGAYGGWTLAKHLGEFYRRGQQQQDLDEARKEYEQALAGQYRTKRAFLDWLDAIPGAYAALAVPAAVGTGVYAYQKHKKDNTEIVRAALRRRAMLRMLESPPEIHLVPQAIPESSRKKKKTDDEE